LEKELETLSAQIEFETASAGMQTLQDAPAEATVSWLSGFIPADKLVALKQSAGENSWALVMDDPAPADRPPTLLRNGPVARIIQPLFTFLGTIPGYREFDISPSYLIFFSIFFAMILGDAAYGMVIMGIALAVGFSFKKKGAAFPDIAKLLVFLASTTIVWGTITGSWFMIGHESLPLFLTALILPPFNNTGPLMEFPLFLQRVFSLPAEVPVDEFKTHWSIQFLCFTIAVTQLTWARTKRIMRLLPSLSAVAQVGWFILMLGIYFLVLSMLLGVGFPAFAPWLLGTGIALILIFSEQKGGNFLVNIGKSCAGLFPLFLKTVSCFADIISYIRLFAVGLAGAMIGITFNQMAFPDDGLGYGLAFVLRLVVAVVLVVFGHGLNLALASLSVIVHGVRLNLLEYAGNHLEMEWSGYAYNPFALKQKSKL
jgi:V/A-type H+-transporting ATPase subunit I